MEAQLFHSSSDRAIDQGNEKPLPFSIRTKPMKQRGFHRNKTSIAHFSRSLFGNLVAYSDQVFLPIDIFPLQDLVLDVFPETIHSAECRRSPPLQEKESVRAPLLLPSLKAF